MSAGAGAGERIDLRGLVARMSGPTAENTVTTFEKGRAVRRTFAEAARDVLAARDRLEAWGVEAGSRVGIRAPNCYPWLTHDLAAIELGAQTVAFTPDFNDSPFEELRARYGISLLLVGPADPAAKAGDPGVAVLGAGGEARAVAGERTGDDPDLDRPGLIFSSGSAGGIKGMVLDRRGVEDSIDAFVRSVRPRRDDRLLLFLPISNYQQRLMYYAAFWYGFDLLVCEPTHMFRALGELAPTILIAPPALYETFETRFDNLPPAKRRAALLVGRLVRRLPSAALRRRLGRAVFRAAHDALGGRVRFLITGMAPIKGSTLELFWLMQLPLYETYGLIESGSVALNLPGATRLGSVGRPLPGVSVELRPDGEILVRRRHAIASGYFQCAEGEGEATFVGDAVATGDVGRVDEDGFLWLVGRKKEVIVTEGGEKVHPEVLEAAIAECPDVQRAVVCEGPADGAGALAAVVLPKRPDDAAARARIEAFVEELNGRWRNVGVGRVVFTDVTFTRENGLLRPNLKLDRRRIAEHFRPQLETGEAGGSA